MESAALGQRNRLNRRALHELDAGNGSSFAIFGRQGDDDLQGANRDERFVAEAREGAN